MAKPPPRLFVDQDLGSGVDVALTQEHAHYLNKVLRLGEGADLYLFNGRDGEWRGSIKDVSRRGGIVMCTDNVRPQGLEHDLTLMFAPVKKTPTEYMIQKATELGVQRLQPVITQRTIETRASPRWAAIAVEAAEQCERLSVPKIEDVKPLDEAVAEMPNTFLLYADETSGDQEAATPPALSVLQTASQNNPWAILVGPAGGFTPDERNALRALSHCHPVRLGPRILKAETAAVVALTLWQATLGDFSS